MTSILDQFKENGQYPIVFIGSGIAQRYFKDSPSWIGLLLDYWRIIGKEENNFYSRLNSIRAGYSGKSLEDQDFLSYTEIASEIENVFNEKYNLDNSIEKELSPKIVFENRLSPFKWSIANRFIKLELIKSEELNYFKKLLTNARIIVTTNYDLLVETLLKEADADYRKYIGDQGFFEPVINWAELYKIHGDVNDSSSIVITSKDYERFDDTSALLNARILTNMTQAPIVFLGYSLNDRNIRSLLADFSKRIPKKQIGASLNSRIVVVEWKEGEEKIQEVEAEFLFENVNVGYTKIQTDNYEQLYKKINDVQQGLTPSEILNYEHLIAKVVTESGRKNSQYILANTMDLKQLSETERKGKKIVVNLGDERLQYVVPDIVSFVKNNLMALNQIPFEVALKFINSISSSQYLPIGYFLDNADKEKFDKSTINKLNKKIRRNGNFENVRNRSQKKQLFDSLDSLRRDFNNIDDQAYLDLIAYNLKTFFLYDKDGLLIHLKSDIFPLLEQGYPTKKPYVSTIRRIFVELDLLINGDWSLIDE